VVSSAHSLSFLNPIPHLKGRDLLLSLPLLFVVRRFQVFSQRFRPYGPHLVEISKVGSSEIFLGGSELWNITVTVLDLGYLYPLVPQRSSLSLAPNSKPLKSVSLTLHSFLIYSLPNPCLALIESGFLK
jgi:hypothetical protein